MTDNEMRIAVDMNAMHEAENTLEMGFDGSPADDYEQALWQIVNPGIEFRPETLYDVGYLWNLIHATANQRAEAFFRVTGKWKEKQVDAAQGI